MTMTDTHRHSRRQSRRRLDVAGLALLLIGLTCGALSYWLIQERGLTPLALVPSVVAATLGVTHLTKLEAPRD